MDAKEKKAEHIEKYVPESAMHEHIRKKCPDPSVYHQRRYHGHAQRQKSSELRAHKLHYREDKDIYSD